MKKMIQRFFSPPLFEGNEEKNSRARLLNTITILTILGILLIILGILLGGQTPISILIIDTVGLINYLGVFYLVRRAKFSLSGIWYIASGLFFATVSVANLGTIRTPTTSIYIHLVIFAGILFGLKGIIYSTLISILAVLGMILAENARILPQPNYTVTLTQWVTYTAMFGFAGILTYYSYLATQKALERSKNEINDRQRAEEELRKLTRAVEQSPVSIIITDLAGNIEYVNPRFCQVTGYSFTEVGGKNPRILQSGQTAPEIFRSMWNNLVVGKEWRGEFTNRKKDGSIYYESAVISPVTGLTGAVTHYLAVKEDITESKRIRQHILWQRDLAQTLAGITSTRTALNLCLKRTLEAANLDCGGIYLVDRVTGDFELLVSYGFSEDFAQFATHVPAGSPRWQIIMAGKPIYSSYENIRSQNLPDLINEGLRTIGVIPLMYQGKVIACFNLASHSRDEIAPVDREMIEEIALQVGSALVRIQAQEDLQQSHDELSLSEARFRSLFEQTHDAVIMFSLDGQVLVANKQAADILGYTIEELTTLNISDISAESDQSADVRSRALAGETLPIFERLYRKKDGQVFPSEVNLKLISYHGRPTHFQSTIRDISERKRAENALRESETKYRIVADNTYSWEFWADPNGHFIYVSPSCKVYTGYEAEEFKADQTLRTRIVHPDDQAIVQRHMELIRNRIKDENEYRLIHKDGSVRWMSHVCLPIFDDNGNFLGNRGSDRDITSRKLAEEKLALANQQLNEQLELVTRLKDQLQELSLRDPLTKLYNRRLLYEILPREIIRSQREQSCVSLIMIDIDYFKNVNDRFGHAAGDEVLKGIAGLMTGSARASDVSCRYGGEEFLLVLPGTTVDIALKRAEQLRDKCAQTIFLHEGREIRITISLGVATYPDHAKDEDEVLNKADQALYASKKTGRNRVTVWA